METKNNSNDTVRNNIVIIHVYVYIPFFMYHCYLMILWYHTILILIKLLRLGNTKNAFEQKLRLWWKTITLDYMSDWLSSAMYWTVLNDDHTITYLYLFGAMPSLAGIATNLSFASCTIFLIFVYLSFLTSTISVRSNPQLHVCTTFWYNDLITFFLVLHFVGLWCCFKSTYPHYVGH